VDGRDKPGQDGFFAAAGPSPNSAFPAANSERYKSLFSALC
jgi:hypothetical protein